MLPAPPDDPAEAMATLMPITSPSVFSSAPPELPGLIAASVWMTESEIVPEDAGGGVVPSPGMSKFQKSNGPSPPSSGGVESSDCDSSGSADEATVMLRLSALTMPLDTVPARPSGAPIATAVSPTLSFDESAKVAASSPLASVSLITARSAIGSMPTTVALYSRPSFVVTVIVGSETEPSRVTTCAFVST